MVASVADIARVCFEPDLDCRQRLVAPSASRIHPRLLVEKRKGDHCGILVLTRAVAVLDNDLVEELGDIVYVQDRAVGDDIIMLVQGIRSDPAVGLGLSD